MPSEPSSAPEARSVCGLALGAVSGAFRTLLAQQLPDALYALTSRSWTVTSIPDSSTDALWDFAASQEAPPWTALLVTSELYGSLSLAQVLANVRHQWPTLRIAVIVGALTQATRQLIATCAAQHIYNVVVGDDQLTARRIAEVVVRDGTWEDLRPYLAEAVVPATAVSAPPPASTDGPDDDPWTTRDRARRTRWWGQRFSPAVPAPLRFIRRRTWLLLGASGGAGTSSVAAALALTWRRAGLTVGVIDASPTGGFLGLPLGCDLADRGWESGHPLTEVAGTWHRHHWLVPHGIGPGASGTTGDVIPYVAEVRKAPVDVWLVDGGLDTSLIGRGAPWWDGVLGIVRPDWPGWHAALRQAAIWRDTPAFAGVVLVQHRPDRVAINDWAALWRVPVLTVLPPEPETIDALWKRGQVPDAWRAVLQRLTHTLWDAPDMPWDSSSDAKER